MSSDITIYVGSAIYTAGIPSTTCSYKRSPDPMVWGPLSEVPQIGRMPIFILTLAVLIVLHVPTALTTNYGMLMAFRFLTRFFVSPILATGGATVADLYTPKKCVRNNLLGCIHRIRIKSRSGFSPHILSGWRWTIWELLWLSSATIVLPFFSGLSFAVAYAVSVSQKTTVHTAVMIPSTAVYAPVPYR